MKKNTEDEKTVEERNLITILRSLLHPQSCWSERTEAKRIITIGMLADRLYKLRRKAGRNDWRAFVEEALGVSVQVMCNYRRLARECTIDELERLGTARCLALLRAPESVRSEFRQKAAGLPVRGVVALVHEARREAGAEDNRGTYRRVPGARRRRRGRR